MGIIKKSYACYSFLMFINFRFLMSVNENWCSRTPDRTPRSSRKVFGSIEKSLDKMRNMLTPRRRLNSDQGPSYVDSKVTNNFFYLFIIFIDLFFFKL